MSTLTDPTDSIGPVAGTATASLPNPHELVSSVVNLVSLPEVYLRAKALLEDADASLTDVAKVIAQDPALTARLLKIANSALFGSVARIETVSRAITLLGTQQIHDLLLATSVTKAFAGIKPATMHMEQFWRNSMHCGVLSRLLAARCNVLDSERLFVAGLLRDIGHLIIYQKLPALAAQALERARGEGIELFRVERDVMGFDYAQVGTILMQTWRLPASLQEAVHYHPEPAKARDFPLETAIVHIASRLVDTHWTGDKVLEQGAIHPVAWQHTGLSIADLPAVKDEAEQQLAAAVTLFLGP